MAKKKKVTKASKRRLMLFGTVSIFIVFYFLFSAAYYGYKIISLKNEEKKLEQNLTNLEKEEKMLSSEMDKLKDPDYLAKYARETYSYSKDDEIIIQQYEEKENNEENKKNNFILDEKYIIGIFIGVMLIIFIFIIRRSLKK